VSEKSYNGRAVRYNHLREYHPMQLKIKNLSVEEIAASVEGQDVISEHDLGPALLLVCKDREGKHSLFVSTTEDTGCMVSL
jgi:hypothetical protein